MITQSWSWGIVSLLSGGQERRQIGTMESSEMRGNSSRQINPDKSALDTTSKEPPLLLWGDQKSDASRRLLQTKQKFHVIHLLKKLSATVITRGEYGWWWGGWGGGWEWEGGGVCGRWGGEGVKQLQDKPKIVFCPMIVEKRNPKHRKG